MQTLESYVNERLDHLGLVAEVCQEIGLAAYLDRLAGETNKLEHDILQAGVYGGGEVSIGHNFLLIAWTKGIVVLAKMLSQPDLLRYLLHCFPWYALSIPGASGTRRKAASEVIPLRGYLYRQWLIGLSICRQAHELSCIPVREASPFSGKTVKGSQ